MRKTLFILLIISSLSATAIVVRHDVDDKKYLAKGSDFLPLATLYIDGAHGTLIQPDWIVTAAHATFCINPGSYIQLNNSNHEVRSVYVHRGYQPGKSHDIALIKLVNPIVNIKPASLYEQTDELGRTAWFIGVGGTGNGLTGQTIDNYDNGGILRKAQNKIDEAKGPLLKFTFDKGDAALPLEGVSGGGDSGGPAYFTSGGAHYLLGISSRVEGKGIGRYGVKEVYSRVSFFKPWIEEIITSESDQRRLLALPKLSKLPTGLTEQILPDVCSDIGIKPDAV